MKIHGLTKGRVSTSYPRKIPMISTEKCGYLKIPMFYVN